MVPHDNIVRIQDKVYCKVIISGSLKIFEDCSHEHTSLSVPLISLFLSLWNSHTRFSLITGNEYFHHMSYFWSTRLYIELKYNDSSFRYVDYSYVFIQAASGYYRFYNHGTVTGNASKNFIKYYYNDASFNFT